MGAGTFISGKLRMKSKAVIVSTAVSFFVMIIAIAVASGFRYQIRRSVSDVCGDLRVTNTYGISESAGIAVDASSEIFRSIADIPGVKQLRPVIYRGGIVRNGDDMHGVVFRAVDFEAAGLYRDGDSSEGSMADSIAVIPKKLAGLLRLSLSDRMLAYFVGDYGNLSVRKFTVGGSYDGIITSDDKLVVECSVAVLRRVNEWEKGQVSAVEVVLEDDCLSDEEMGRVEEKIDDILFSVNNGSSSDLRCENLRDSYSQLFDWLKLIDANVSFILVLMIIVAGFNMVTGLLIFLFENMKTIGLLKSLGMSPRSISCSFLLSAARSVAVGMVSGNVLALIFCLVQKHTHFLTLNPENYFISFVPVNVELPALLCCDVAAFAAIMLALLIPCAFIAGLQPAKTLVSD